MSSTPRPGAQPQNADDVATFAMAGAALVAGPVAVGLMLVLRPLVVREPRGTVWAALIGVVLTSALWPLFGAEGMRALRAVMSTPLSNGNFGAALGPAVTWWLGLAGLGPALAWGWDWVRPKTLRELEDREARRYERAQVRDAGGPDKDAAALPGIALGVKLEGDRVLPARKRELVLPLSWLGRHALVFGASGSGKTETLLRLGHEVARTSDWAVFFMDGKGDRETMRRFYALMNDAGRRPRLFPDEGYDGWRGTSADIAARLVEVIDFAEEGPGAYYRDQAVNLIRLACQAPGGPPRSANELLARFELEELASRFEGDPGEADVRSYTARQIAEVRARYSAFFGAVGARLDAGWAFEDADAGYRCSTACGSSTRRLGWRGFSSRTSRSTPSTASRATGACCSSSTSSPP